MTGQTKPAAEILRERRAQGLPFSTPPDPSVYGRDVIGFELEAPDVERVAFLLYKQAGGMDTPVMSSISDREFYIPRAKEILDAVNERCVCVMTHTPPYDFAQCETHDETFPLGEKCKFDGREPWEVFAEEADEQRGRASLAEMDLEHARAAGASYKRQRDELKAEAERLQDFQNEIAERMPPEFDGDEAQEYLIDHWLDVQARELAEQRIANDLIAEEASKQAKRAAAAEDERDRLIAGAGYSWLREQRDEAQADAREAHERLREVRAAVEEMRTHWSESENDRGIYFIELGHCVDVEDLLAILDDETAPEQKCSQCGKGISDTACGPTHALLYHEQKQAAQTTGVEGDGVIECPKCKSQMPVSGQPGDHFLLIHEEDGSHTFQRKGSGDGSGE